MYRLVVLCFTTNHDIFVCLLLTVIFLCDCFYCFILSCCVLLYRLLVLCFTINCIIIITPLFCLVDSAKELPVVSKKPRNSPHNRPYAVYYVYIIVTCRRSTQLLHRVQLTDTSLNFVPCKTDIF